MASRKTLLPSTSHRSTAAAAGLGHKKTKSEELLATLKSYGYVPPKNHRPEHYDYLFQDRKTAQFIQKLTSKITNQNIVGKEEMDTIQQLKEQNLLVYGKSLETFVNKANEVKQAKQSKTLEREKQLESLKQRIQDKKRNIEKLKSVQSAFDANEEKKKSERSLLEYVNDSCESECTFLAQTIDVEESDHQEVQKFCFEAIERIIDLIQSPSAQVVTELMEHGVEVENTVRQRMKVKLDLESELLSQPMSPYEICKTFQQYGKDFERLKHVIIYEIIRQLENQCNESCKEVILEQLADFKKESNRFKNFSSDIQKKMIEEKMESIELIEKSVEAHVQKKLTQIRQNLVSRFDEDTREVQQKKYDTRKQIQTYYEVFVDVLIKQLANVLISDYAITIKSESAQEFINCLTTFCEKSNEIQMETKYLTEDVTEDNIALDCQNIAQIFKCYGIPLGILRSHQATLHALALLNLKEQHLIVKQELKQDLLQTQELQDTIQRSVTLKKQWISNKVKLAQWKEDFEVTKKQESTGQQFKEAIKESVMCKEKLVNESIKKKEDLLNKMTESLQAYSNLKDKRNKGNLKNRRSSLFDKTGDSASFVY